MRKAAWVFYRRAFRAAVTARSVPQRGCCRLDKLRRCFIIQPRLRHGRWPGGKRRCQPAQRM